MDSHGYESINIKQNVITKSISTEKDVFAWILIKFLNITFS